MKRFASFNKGLFGFDRSYEVIEHIERDLFKRRKTINAEKVSYRAAA